MTDLEPWNLGAPLTITMEDVATGKNDTTSLPIGRLAWSREHRRAIFEPSAEAVRAAVPLSPFSIDVKSGVSAGDHTEFGGLHGVFADSLPDGWGRLLVDREAESRGLRRSDLTPVDRLAIVGTSGMGALAYRPEADRQQDKADMDLALLADAVQRILGEAREPTIADAVKLRAALGGSGGARPKIVCQIAEQGGDNATLRPAHAKPDPTFGHWIVKFANTGDGPYAAQIEHAYALMAASAGIDMPETRLVRAKDGRCFFAIRRFDRDVIKTPQKPVLRRWHMLSASGALQSEHSKFAFDYETLLTWAWKLTKDQIAVEEMFRRAAFNVMAHNRDDHGLQHRAMLDMDDAKMWRWRVSPAYDLTPSDGPGGEHSLTIAGAGKDITRDHLMKLAEQSPIPAGRATTIIDQVSETVARWNEFAERVELPRAPCNSITQLHSIL
ncbi:type II toxin-antitoxin system HipA family toxin [Thalassospira lucentensis]|uniref:type II toxin-antitoxin system HipA family toxin n=1 Tax=Thalassospira lucentensis TaxID=168935 RepID=UPI003AA7BD74